MFYVRIPNSTKILVQKSNCPAVTDAMFTWCRHDGGCWREPNYRPCCCEILGEGGVRIRANLWISASGLESLMMTDFWHEPSCEAWVSYAHRTTADAPNSRLPGVPTMVGAGVSTAIGPGKM